RSAWTVSPRRTSASTALTGVSSVTGWAPALTAVPASRPEEAAATAAVRVREVLAALRRPGRRWRPGVVSFIKISSNAYEVSCRARGGEPPTMTVERPEAPVGPGADGGSPAPAAVW